MRIHITIRDLLEAIAIISVMMAVLAVPQPAEACRLQTLSILEGPVAWNGYDVAFYKR